MDYQSVAMYRRRRRRKTVVDFLRFADVASDDLAQIERSHRTPTRPVSRPEGAARQLRRIHVAFATLHRQRKDPEKMHSEAEGVQVSAKQPGSSCLCRRRPVVARSATTEEETTQVSTAERGREKTFLRISGQVVLQRRFRESHCCEIDLRLRFTRTPIIKKKQ